MNSQSVELDISSSDSKSALGAIFWFEKQEEEAYKLVIRINLEPYPHIAGSLPEDNTQTFGGKIRFTIEDFDF